MFIEWENAEELSEIQQEIRRKEDYRKTWAQDSTRLNLGVGLIRMLVNAVIWLLECSSRGVGQALLLQLGSKTSDPLLCLNGNMFDLQIVALKFTLSRSRTTHSDPGTK
jgi:hypothetical protein